MQFHLEKKSRLPPTRVVSHSRHLHNPFFFKKKKLKQVGILVFDDLQAQGGRGLVAVIDKAYYACQLTHLMIASQIPNVSTDTLTD